MPSCVAVTTTRRQLSIAASIASRKYGRDDQRRQLRVLVERVLDAVEELGADDAAAAPDGRHVAGGEVPAVLRAARLDLVEALRVRDDLRRVQRLPDVLGELARRRWAVSPRSPGRQPGGGLALGDRSGQRAGEHGLGDAGDRHTEIQRGLHRPAAGALLLGFIEDDVDQRLAGLRVALRAAPLR